METEGSLSCSPGPATGPCPDPDLSGVQKIIINTDQKHVSSSFPIPVFL